MGRKVKSWDFQIEGDIVERVKESLRYIGGYCPDSIVKKAREKESTVKQPVNKELPNALIQLDNEIKIDIDNEHMQEFSEAILKFVKGISLFIEKSTGLLFKINPAGSFPLGNKIEEIDEFDFVLECINMPKTLMELPLQDIRDISFKPDHFHYPGMIIRPLLLECQYVDNVTITTLIQKRFAMNLVISWKCSCSQKHKVSLDLAVSLKSKNFTYHKHLEKMDMFLKDTPFEETIESDGFSYHCFPFACEGEDIDHFGDCRLDTNYFDKCMFDTCEKISPNIKLCFRITKFICSRFFPKLWSEQRCMIKRKEMNVFQPIISSYILKQLLFREVIDFPSSENWSAALIHLRLTSLLKRLQKVTNVYDLLNPSEIKRIKPEEYELLFEHFDTWINKLISCFQHGFTERIKQLAALKKVESRSKQLWFFRNVFIITAREPKLLGPNKPITCLLFKLDIPKIESETSYIKRIVYNIQNEIISEVIDVDLSRLTKPQSEKCLSLFLFLYSGNLGLLEEDDVKSNMVIKKLNIILKIFETFEIRFKEAFSVLLEFEYLTSCKDDNVINMSSIFSQITMKEAGCIYRHFQQQAFRNNETVYDVNENNFDSALPRAVFKDAPRLLQRSNKTDPDEKEILLSRKELEPLDRCCAKHKAHIWLYSAIMKSFGKI